MKIDKEHLDILRSLKVKPRYTGSWLGKDPNKAILIALGAGPWKFKRRADVQRKAWKWYKNKRYDDLLYAKFEKIYPLDWENNFLKTLLSTLKRRQRRFNVQCRLWAENDFRVSLPDLFASFGLPEKGAKVIWLFARDFLELPAFPIDRWVGRKLDELGLPKEAWYMTYACIKADLNPNEVNRSLFPADNPDWS